MCGTQHSLMLQYESQRNMHVVVGVEGRKEWRRFVVEAPLMEWS